MAWMHKIQHSHFNFHGQDKSSLRISVITAWSIYNIGFLTAFCQHRHRTIYIHEEGPGSTRQKLFDCLWHLNHKIICCKCWLVNFKIVHFQDNNTINDCLRKKHKINVHLYCFIMSIDCLYSHRATSECPTEVFCCKTHLGIVLHYNNCECGLVDWQLN